MITKIKIKYCSDLKASLVYSPESCTNQHLVDSNAQNMRTTTLLVLGSAVTEGDKTTFQKDVPRMKQQLNIPQLWGVLGLLSLNMQDAIINL